MFCIYLTQMRNYLWLDGESEYGTGHGGHNEAIHPYEARLVSFDTLIRVWKTI